MSTHTRTPWFLSETSDSFQVRGDGKEVFYSSPYDDIAPNRENTCFIIQAVNSHDALLEACRAALYNDGGYNGWKNQVEAAIKLAEEGQP